MTSLPRELICSHLGHSAEFSLIAIGDSVIEFFQGHLGQPTGGFPEPLRSKIIRNLPRIDGRPGLGMKPYDFPKVRKGEAAPSFTLAS